MVTEKLLYLRKNNRSTIIRNLFQEEICVNLTIDSILEDACLKDLTTLKGRIDAISKVYHIYKHIPIYLTDDIILITTSNKKRFDNIYINICNIVDMVRDNNSTIIIFFDRSYLVIDKPYHLIKKYYDKSININKFERKNKNGKEKY